MAFGRSKDRPEPSAATPARSTGSPQQGSVIAPGMVLTGDCEADGPLRVDGHVTGSVRAARLTIGPGGRVDGDVTGARDGGSDPAVVIEGAVGGAVNAARAEIGPKGSVGGGMKVTEAVVRGRVVGGIENAQRLVLEETAVVEGDVTAQRLGLREGGQVFGTIRIGDRPGGASGGPGGSSSSGRDGSGRSSAAAAGSPETGTDGKADTDEKGVTGPEGDKEKAKGEQGS